MPTASRSTVDEHVLAGISQMSVDLVVRNLVRLSCSAH
jgi:hypothetical protein